MSKPHKKSINQLSDDREEKRGPGRPRKNPVHEPRPRNGISEKPKEQDNFMEYVYDQPLITKKIWGYFRTLFTDHLELIFRKDEIIYYGKGHLGKNRVRTRINVAKVNHYYTKEALNIGVACSDVGTIMSKIDKTYNSIMFLSNKNYIRTQLRITLQNDLEIDEVHDIGLMGKYENMQNEQEFLDEDDYPISFVLSGKYFKKMINDIKGFGKKLVIKQDGPKEPLVFGYQKPNGNVKGNNVCRNKKKIKFKSKLKEDESFRVEIFVEYIKPLSSAVLADEITIYAHETKPLLLVAKVDVTEVRVLTEIINERQANEST